MNTQAPFLVTEWEWLKLTLRLHALEVCTGEEEIRRFDCDSMPGTIICNIYSDHAEDMATLQVPRHEQLEYYQSWADGIKADLERLLEAYPVLQQTTDLDTQVIVRVLYEYIDPLLICEIIGETVRWGEILSGGETIYVDLPTA